MKELVEAVDEVHLERFVLQQFPEEQGRSGACWIAVWPVIGCVGEGIVFLFDQADVTVKEDPASWAVIFLPAAHVVGWPIEIGGEDFKDLVVDEIADVYAVRHIGIGFWVGEVVVGDEVV